MLEIQKSYQAMLKVLRGEREFVPKVIANFENMALSKQIECIVEAIGENAAKNKESAPSASANMQSTAIAQLKPQKPRSEIAWCKEAFEICKKHAHSDDFIAMWQERKNAVVALLSAATLNERSISASTLEEGAQIAQTT